MCGDFEDGDDDGDGDGGRWWVEDEYIYFTR